MHKDSGKHTKRISSSGTASPRSIPDIEPRIKKQKIKMPVVHEMGESLVVKNQMKVPTNRLPKFKSQTTEPREKKQRKFGKVEASLGKTAKSPPKTGTRFVTEKHINLKMERNLTQTQPRNTEVDDIHRTETGVTSNMLDFARKPARSTSRSSKRSRSDHSNHSRYANFKIPGMHYEGNENCESDVEKQSIFNPRRSEKLRKDFMDINLNDLPDFRGEDAKPSPSQRGSVKGRDSIMTYKEEKDKLSVTQLEKLLHLEDAQKKMNSELVRWKFQDVKGRRQTQYIKKIVNKNDQVMKVANLDELEMLANKNDSFPCLNLRKKILKVKILIVMACEKIINHNIFEAASISIILLNCVTLAMEDPTQKEETTSDLIWEYTFQGLYTVEMMFKIIGMGFLFNKGAYLRDYFNILDFVIIMSAYVTMATPLIESMTGADEKPAVKSDEEEEGLSLSSLRAFRVLRPLRAITSIQGLKILVSSVISSLPFLKHTIIVLLFFFLIFAIAGVNLFSGMLKQRCVNYETGRMYQPDDEDFICGATECPEGYFCGKMNVNPNYEVTNFDNIFWALLVVFQCITLEGWSDVQTLYQMAYTYYVFLFFVPLVFMGAFFLLNLVLAVINNSFSENQKKFEEDQRKIEAERNKLKKKKTDDDGGGNEKEQAAEQEDTLGVAEFFLARRAAQKMMHWYKIEKAEDDKRKWIEAEKQRKIRAEEEEVERKKEEEFQRSQTRRAAVLSSMKSEDADAKPETVLNRLKKRLSLRRIQSSEVKLTNMPAHPMAQSKVDEAPGIDKSKSRSKSESITSVISEEQEESERSGADSHKLKVANFLKDLEEGIDTNKGGPSETILSKEQSVQFAQGKTLDEYKFPQMLSVPYPRNVESRISTAGPNGLHAKKNSRAFEMALIEDRRATPELRKNLNTAGGQGSTIKKREKEKKKKKRVLDIYGSPVDSDNESIGIFKDESRVNQELGIENFIQPDDGGLNQSMPTNKQPNDYLEDDYFDFHPYDMRLGQEENKHNISERIGLKSILDSQDKSSIIGSDILSSDAQEFGFLKSGTGPMWNTKEFEKMPGKIKFADAHQQESRHSGDSPVRSKPKERIEKLRYAEPRSRQSQVTPTSPELNRAGKAMKVVGQRRGTLLRFQTSSNRNMNKTLESTVVGFNSQANVNETNDQMNQTAVANPKTLASARSNLSSFSIKEKKRMMNIYSKTDLSEFKIKPNQMFSAQFDLFYRKKEKIRSNPNQQYHSTSEHEVFEIRNKLQDRERVSQVNNFLAVGDDHGSDSELSNYEIPDIKPACQPYQLKTTYCPLDKMEFELDEDDDDYYEFALQPFDTVSNIGYNELLTHLPTKFLARRSDIIVSSTLSFTLTPTEEKFIPMKKALMNDAEVTDWIDKRQEFRALEVKTAELQRHSYGRNTYGEDDTIKSVSSYYTDEEVTQHPGQSGQMSPVNDSMSVKVPQDEPLSPLSPTPTEFGNSQQALSPNQAEKEKVYVRKKRAIPKNLLIAPLPDVKVGKMGQAERKLYKIWQEKYKGAQLRRDKQQQSKESPADKKLTLADAELMMKGEYYKEDQERDGADKPNEIDKVNKAIFIGDRANLQDELNIGQFEEAIKDVMEQDYIMPINREGDCIPDHLRKELGLPSAEEMESQNCYIDFNEVRRKDASLKNKKYFWSGQDVLNESINKAMSLKTIKQLNKVRTWPLFFFGYVKKARCLLKMFVRTSLFDNFMTLSVLLNTIVMAMDKYGIDKELEAQLEEINSVFTWIFIVEMSCKLLAMGPKKYVGEKMNILDGAVVSLSIIEMAIAAGGGDGGGGSLQAFRTIRVFRTFRVLRVTRLLRALQQMQVIVGVILKSFWSFVYITVLLFIFVFIYALLGMQFFGGLYDFGDGVFIRTNFDTFWIAFVTVFQVLTMENWQDNLFSSMRTTTPKPVTAAFYISWIFIGNIVLLNLFLAILLDAFISENETSEADTDAIDAAEKQLEIQRKQWIIDKKNKRSSQLAKYRKYFPEQLQRAVTGSPANSNMPEFNALQESKRNTAKKKQQKASLTGQAAVEGIEDIEDLNTKEIRKYLEKEALVKKDTKGWAWKPVKKKVKAEKSLYLFEKRSAFRRLCFNVQKHKKFDQFIMALIFLSSLKLATDTYMTPDDYPKDHILLIISENVDNFFTWIFFTESLIKVIALGFVMDEESYLRDGWSQLDFFIVVTSLIDFSLQGVDIPAIKILRLLRTFRPLRVISHNKSLRLIVTALFGSMSAIVQVAIVILVVWLMFAIFGISTYKGNFFHCSELKYFYHDEQSCEEAGHKWEVFPQNFDDIGHAMLTLFVISSLEGWPDIMYQALDIVGVDKGPLLENQTYQAAFFILFILIGSFFFLNFFIGVLFLKYNQADKAEKKGFTEEHLDWIELQTMILKASCPHNVANKPQHGLRRKVFEIVDSDAFDIGIMIAIVLNMFQMALLYEGASEEWESFLDVTNYIFSTIFLVEAILKLYVYRKSYFETGWNKFDFFVVVSSLFDIGMKFLPQGGDNQILQVVPQLARVFRVLRVSRVLRLAGKYKELQTLLQTIERSVQSIMNVFLLLMLIFFMFATLGVFFFADITEGEIIDPEFKNFTRFGDAFLLLFAVSTGEAWNEIMYDCYLAPDDCVKGVNCGTPFAPAYFIVFIMLVTHVMLNLFILVIIEQFERFYLNKNSPLISFAGTLEDYQKKWAAFALPRYKCCVIREKDLDRFYKTLKTPLGSPTGTHEDMMKKKILRMGIKCENGYVQFNELLYRLMRDIYGGQPGGKVFRLTQKMQIIEITTQFKLYQLSQKQFERHNIISEKKGPDPEVKRRLTLQNIRRGSFKGLLGGGKKKKDAKTDKFFTIKDENVNSVNPFLTRMFFRISFQTWRSVTKKYEKRRLEMANRANEPFSSGRESPGLNIVVEKEKYEEVKVARDPIEVLYSSDESEEDEHKLGSGSKNTSKVNLEAKKHRSRKTHFGKPSVGMGVLSGGDLEESSEGESIDEVVKSPDVHRNRAKNIKIAAERRFSTFDPNAFGLFMNNKTRDSRNFSKMKTSGDCKITSPKILMSPPSGGTRTHTHNTVPNTETNTDAQASRIPSRTQSPAQKFNQKGMRSADQNIVLKNNLTGLTVTRQQSSRNTEDLVENRNIPHPKHVLNKPTGNGDYVSSPRESLKVETINSERTIPEAEVPRQLPEGKKKGFQPKNRGNMK